MNHMIYYDCCPSYTSFVGHRVAWHTRVHFLKKRKGMAVTSG